MEAIIKPYLFQFSPQYLTPIPDPCCKLISAHYRAGCQRTGGPATPCTNRPQILMHAPQRRETDDCDVSILQLTGIGELRWNHFMVVVQISHQR